jgi:deoxyribodipyrimidine photo-lyase
MSYLEKNKTHIHWFRNDLRIDDQPFDFLADKTHFFGVYIISPLHIRWTKYGFRKMGFQRLYYLRESLYELQHTLREKGSDLLVRFGATHEVLKELSSLYNATVSFQREYGTEEKEEENLIQNALGDQLINSWEGGFLIEPQLIDFHNNKFPNSFSGFRKKAESLNKPLDYRTYPTRNTLPPTPKTFASIKKPNYQKNSDSSIPFPGGCISGKKRVQQYFFDSHNVQNYKDTRNGLIGADYSSKFSIYLANGALSPKQIMAALVKFEQTIVKNKSTYWLWFELLWRDFFRHALHYYGKKMFYPSVITDSQQVIKNTDTHFSRWIQGKTPASFVNAMMKELAITGYMSNRGRQNAASYLIHDYGVDWRLGAAWFEHCLVDYDVASNQGNWMYIAGVRFNPKGKSYFTIDTQQNHYDPELEYTQLWKNRIL